MPSPAPQEPSLRPALEALHPLILSLWQGTRRLPPGDPTALALRLRGAALGAAESLLRAAVGDGRPEIVAAARLLREVAYHLDLARRLRYVSLGTATEILEHQTRASLEVALLVRSSEPTPPPPPPPAEIRRVPAGPRRFRLLAAFRRGVARA